MDPIEKLATEVWASLAVEARRMTWVTEVDYQLAALARSRACSRCSSARARSSPPSGNRPLSPPWHPDE